MENLFEKTISSTTFGIYQCNNCGDSTGTTSPSEINPNKAISADLPSIYQKCECGGNYQPV